MFRPFTLRAAGKPKEHITLAPEDKECEHVREEEKIASAAIPAVVAKALVTAKNATSQSVALSPLWTRVDIAIVSVLAMITVFMVIWLIVGWGTT